MDNLLLATHSKSQAVWYKAITGSYWRCLKQQKSKRPSKSNFLIKSIENNQGIEVVETNYANLAEAYDKLEGKHETYIDLCRMNSLKKKKHGWQQFKRNLMMQLIAKSNMCIIPFWKKKQPARMQHMENQLKMRKQEGGQCAQFLKLHTKVSQMPYTQRKFLILHWEIYKCK